MLIFHFLSVIHFKTAGGNVWKTYWENAAYWGYQKKFRSKWFKLALAPIRNVMTGSAMRLSAGMRALDFY